MTRDLRAGVLGLGMMGRHHVRALSELQGVSLVGAADPDGDPHGAAARHGVPLVDGLEALLALGLDMCVVAVPTDEHLAAGLRLADAGVPCLVEKPLAGTVEEARRLVDAFRESGTLAGVGHIERYNPALQAMRRRIEDGQLGDIYQVVTRRQGPFPGRVRDVGVIKDLATHDVDLTAWVAGSRYASVSALTTCRAGREHEDLVAAIGSLTSGVVTSHLVNWLSPAKERRVVVTGERGCLEADLLSADLVFHANGVVVTEWEAVSRFRGVTEGDMTRYAIAKPEPLAAELAAFRDGVLGDPSGLVALADGLVAVQVATAMVRSARDGTRVQVGP